jgi:copper chaperone NosL
MIQVKCSIFTKILLVIIVSGVFLLSCSTEPEPLKYGTDVCYFCKMTLVDQKFGAELITRKGKVYKFDDLNCFLNFYNSGEEAEDDFSSRLVVDYSNPGNLIPAREAFYLKSAEIRSPMNGNVAAFESKASMDTFKKQWKGIYLAWGEVVTQFK